MQLEDNQNLAVRLDAYEAASSDATISTWKKRLGNWPIYAAAAGSALASSTAASAAIISSGPQNLTASITHFTTVTTASFRVRRGNAAIPINIDGLGNIFSFGEFAGNAQRIGSVRPFTATGAGPFSGYFFNNNGGARQAMGTFGQLKRLHSGSAISSKGAFAAGRLNMHSANILTSNGQWSSGGPAFAGVKFTEGGQTHFGWIQLEFGGGTITAIDWAYNSVAGAPIEAGQTPEPGTLGLGLLSAGFLGVLAWRRSRQRVSGQQASVIQ